MRGKLRFQLGSASAPQLLAGFGPALAANAHYLPFQELRQAILASGPSDHHLPRIGDFVRWLAANRQTRPRVTRCHWLLWQVTR